MSQTPGIPWSLPNAGFSIQPVNGEFAAWSQGSSVPPDGWVMDAGSWGVAAARCQGGTGPWAVDFGTAAKQGRIVSDLVVVLPNTKYLLSALYRIVTGSGVTLSQGVRVDFYDDSRKLISSTNLDLIANTAGVWTYSGMDVVTPTNAVYAKVLAGRFNENGSTNLQVDAVKFDRSVYIPSGVISLDDVTDGVEYARPKGAYLSGGIVKEVLRGVGTVATDLLFKKTNTSDPDTLDGIPNGSTYGRPKLDALTAGGYPDMDKVADGALFRRVGVSYVDSSNRITAIRNVVDNVDVAGSAVFRKSTDTFASVAGTIATSQFGAGVVDANAIGAGAVTTVKLGALAVTTAKIAAGAVTNSELGDLSISSGKLQDSAVTTAKLNALAVDSTKLAAAAVTTTKIATGAVTNAELGDLSISSGKLQDSAVTNAKIGALAVDSGKIAASAVTTGKIATGAVTSNELGALAVTTAKIAAGAVTNSELGDLSISSGKLQDSAVTTAKLNNLAVDSTKLAAAAVTTAKIATGAVTTNELGSLAVTTAKIAAGAVTTSELGALAVTTAKIAAGAVTNSELGALAVDSAKLAAGAVTTAKIATGAVTSNELGALAVTTAKIASGAVTTNELGALAVTNAKLASLSVATGNIQTGAVTSNQLGANAVTAAKIADLAVGAPELDDGISIAAYDEAGPQGIFDRATATNCTKQATYVEGNPYYIRFTVATSVTNPQISTGLYTGTSTNLYTTKAVVRYRLSGEFTSKAPTAMTVVNTGNTAQTATAVFLSDGNWHTAVFDISAWTSLGTLRFDLTTATTATAYIDISYVGTGNPASGTGALSSYRGKIGVNTSVPGAMLHITPSTTSTVAARISSTWAADSTARGVIDWRDATNTVGAIWTDYDGTSVAFRVGSLYNAGYNSNTNFTVRGNGYNGFGTSSPTNRLDVATLNNWDLTNTEGDMRVGDSTYRMKIGIANGGGGAGTASIAMVGGVNALRLGSGTTTTTQGAITINNGVTTVTQPSWIAPTLLNSFYNFNATTYQSAGYYIDSNGRVYLRGLVARASAALNTAIFQLPAGYRPLKTTLFGVLANNFNARLDIDSSGNITIQAADNAGWYGFITLDGVNFDTR